MNLKHNSLKWPFKKLNLTTNSNHNSILYLETKALCDLGDNSFSSKQSVLFTIISILYSTLLTVIGDIDFDHLTKKIKLFAGCLHPLQPDVMYVCDPILNPSGSSLYTLYKVYYT